MSRAAHPYADFNQAPCAGMVDYFRGEPAMAQVSLRRPHRGWALFVGAACMVLCGLLAGGMSPRPALAQTKKATDPKGDPKKAEPKGQPDPKITDVLVSAGGVNEIEFINDQIAKKWKENKITPAKRSTDYEFLRRTYLDIVGRIAKPKEISEYLGWPAEQRRSRLIEKLLQSDEYANNFANIFANLLMTRTGPKLHHEQMQVWLTDEFAKSNADWSKTVTSLLSASGKTNGDKDEPAVNFILAHLGEKLPGNSADNGQYEMVPVTSRITRLFLGLRTQCTQCHDHPFNDEWRQEHFWAINAYLRQVEAPQGRPTIQKKNKGMPADMQYELRDNAAFNKSGLVPYERKSGLVEYTKAFFLDGTKLPAKLEGSRRQELAKRVTSSEYFAKAFVNRMWGHFFGRGFTKDVDDFGEHSQVSHPELLDKLAKDWASKYHHNPRELIRWICHSRAYGLSSEANSTNDKADDEKFFSRMLLKAMTPEQLFESLMIATDAKDGQNRDKRKDLRQQWMDKLVVNFGDDEGNEGNFNGTVVQALLMMNGQEINNAIMDEAGGTVSTVLKKLATVKGAISRKSQEGVVRELFLAGLNRQPTAKELERMLDHERMKLGSTALIDYRFFRGYCQDLFWAMLNSNEFILNH
jgi:hypothetical protein